MPLPYMKAPEALDLAGGIQRKINEATGIDRAYLEPTGLWHPYVEWGAPIKITRSPWYKTTPSGLFWRSRASKGVEAVKMREMVERVNASADALLLLVLGGGDDRP